MDGCRVVQVCRSSVGSRVFFFAAGRLRAFAGSGADNLGVRGCGDVGSVSGEGGGRLWAAAAVVRSPIAASAPVPVTAAGASGETLAAAVAAVSALAAAVPFVPVVAAQWC